MVYSRRPNGRVVVLVALAFLTAGSACGDSSSVTTSNQMAIPAGSPAAGLRQADDVAAMTPSGKSRRFNPEPLRSPGHRNLIDIFSQAPELDRMFPAPAEITASISESIRQKRQPESTDQYVIVDGEVTVVDDDWMDNPPDRNAGPLPDYDDLPDMHETIAELRDILTQAHRNEYDASTPAGALCWVMWEASRGYTQEVYGPAFVEMIRLLEEHSLGVFEGSPEENVSKFSTPLATDLGTGSVGRATDLSQFPNDFSILESLESVGTGEMRSRALDPSLPDSYRILADDFFAVIDEQRALADPEGFNPETFTSDYDPTLDDDPLWCDDYLPHESTAPSTTTETTIPSDGSTPPPQPDDDENTQAATDRDDAPPKTDSDESESDDEAPEPEPKQDPDATPTTTTTTTTTSTTTTTTTTTTVVPTPAPSPPEDSQEAEDSDSDDGDSDVDDPPATEDAETP